MNQLSETTGEHRTRSVLHDLQAISAPTLCADKNEERSRMLKNWISRDVPSQCGRTAIVTGTDGLGFESALAFARAGGDVIVAGRNPARGAEAVARIRKSIPSATVAFELLDLGDLASIAACGDRLNAKRESIDVLINNAGVNDAAAP
ncbi:SDR family NAD(P)-dependent oxidoreductase [Belnapia arida]|nr:SDR family NAD(P)-dependent oxidoreductase [Belnapia arida]